MKQLILRFVGARITVHKNQQTFIGTLSYDQDMQEMFTVTDDLKGVQCTFYKSNVGLVFSDAVEYLFITLKN